MDDKEKIELTSNEGAIVIRENSEPEIFAPYEYGQKCDNVRFTLAFLLYAIEQDDWITQFQDFVETIESDMKENKIKYRRSKFKVIDGDKK